MCVPRGACALGVLLHCSAVRGWEMGSYIRFPSQIETIKTQSCWLPAAPSPKSSLPTYLPHLYSYCNTCWQHNILKHTNVYSLMTTCHVSRQSLVKWADLLCIGKHISFHVHNTQMCSDALFFTLSLHPWMFLPANWLSLMLLNLNIWCCPHTNTFLDVLYTWIYQVLKHTTHLFPVYVISGLLPLTSLFKRDRLIWRKFSKSAISLQKSKSEYA